MTFSDTTCVEEGLKQYFLENGFGPDGGYENNSVPIQVGPLRFQLPNTEARKRAVKRHDIHHLVTGYCTDFLGEAEIAAWELASGCREYLAAWVLNGMALSVGFWMAPKRMIAAWQWGSRCRNLYHVADLAPILQMTLGEARALLGVENSQKKTPFSSDQAGGESGGSDSAG